MNVVKASYQAIFDKVASHLLAQNVQSLNDAQFCAYRGANNTMCAVGCLIDDKNYDKSFEGFSMLDAVDEAPDLLTALGFNVSSLNPYNNNKFRFLMSLQQIHDSFKTEYWYEELAKFAKKHKLNKKVLNKFKKK